MYDIIIIGGGISGLYTYMRLIQNNPNLKITLMEKSNRLGGRIYQYEEELLSEIYSFPAGAARFNTNHTQVIKLMKEFKLLNTQKEKGSISPITFIDVKNNYAKKFSGKNGFIYINKILQKASKESKEKLQQYTFCEFASQVIPHDEVEFMLVSSGYSGQLKHMNMYDAITLFTKGIRVDVPFYGGKFHLLINEITKYLKNNNANIRVRCNVNNVIYNENNSSYQIIHNTSHKSYTKKIIFCLPQPALLKIKFLKNIHCLLQNSITCKPLCRVYAIFKKEDIWFHDLKQKIVTNNKLRYIIPINASKGIIMISYTDDLYTDYWTNIKYSQRLLKTSIVKLVNETFNIKINEPHKVIVCDWSCGVAYWNKNIDSNQVSKFLCNPLPNIYICGENYSLQQSWVEGALETSNNCIKKVLQN